MQKIQADKSAFRQIRPCFCSTATRLQRKSRQRHYRPSSDERIVLLDIKGDTRSVTQGCMEQLTPSAMKLYRRQQLRMWPRGQYTTADNKALDQSTAL